MAEQFTYPPILQDRVFWPRMSEVIGDLVEAVQESPGRPLNDTEKADVLGFERDLIAGHYGNITSEISLDDTPTSVDTAFRFAPSYFVTSTGSRALKDFYPDTIEPVDDFVAAQSLRSIPFVYLSENQDKLKTLSGDSMRFAKSRYAEAAQRDEEIADISTIDINRDPTALISRLRGNLANRNFIREVRAKLQVELAANPTRALEAKLMITDIYRDKISSVIAELYPGLQGLLQQIDVQPEAERGLLMAGLDAIKPLVDVARRGLANTNTQATFMRRLDFVRNGVALDEDGKITTIHGQIYEDAAKINAQAETAEKGTPVFSSDEIEILDKTVVDADTMRALTLDYMDRIGIEGWNVEIRPDVETYSVDGIHKKVKIPKSFKRTPTQVSPVAGVAAIMWHEVGGQKPGHVMQHVNAANDDQALRLGTHPRYKGKRVTSVRETGGITAEASVLHEFFGLERKAKTGFARSMAVIESGGSISRAVAANILASLEMNEDISALDEKQKNTKYLAAADAVLRLTRFGGFNSQPLVYAESATGRRVLEPLDDETEKVVLAEGLFDPIDMLRLHRYGLLVTNTEHLFQPADNPSRVMEQLLRDLLKKQSQAETA